MESKEAVAAFWLFVLGLSYGVEVNMPVDAWKDEFGWQILCGWSASKKVQSVRLYKDEVQVWAFKPEIQGPNIASNFILPPNDTRIMVNCFELGRSGYCFIGVELLSAPTLDAKYKFEASEDLPVFQIPSKFEKGTVYSFPPSTFSVEFVQEWFVPPWTPQLEVWSVDGLAVVNCTATGIPAPTLTWHTGERKIPEIISNHKWNSTTKLWHSWSVISVPDEGQFLSCTATVTKSGRRPEKKTSSKYLKSISNNGKSILGLSYGVELHWTFDSWKAEFGWQLGCGWRVSKKLQSLRLYKDEVQFWVFRPEIQGPNVASNFILPPNDTRILVNCYETGRSGYCYVNVELLSAPTLDAKYKCEASEDLPVFHVPSKFEKGTKYSFPASKSAIEFVQEWFVLPSYPQLEVLSVEGPTTVVNCTATGIPAPTLTWSFERQKIQEFDSDHMWNSTTKLWHSWSVVSVLGDEDQVLSCTATVTKSGKRSKQKTSSEHLKSISNYGKSSIV